MWEPMALGETGNYPGPSPEPTDSKNWELSKVEGAIDKFMNQGKQALYSDVQLKICETGLFLTYFHL